MTSASPTVPTDAPTRPDASVGQRVGALLLDTLIVMLPLFVVSALLFGDSRSGDGGFRVSLTGVPFLLTVLVAFGYFFVTELLAGRTIGKLIVGVRVASEKGPALGAGQVLVRTVLRVVDGFAFYLVGFVVALASAKKQRVGDMVASTRVVRNR